MQAARLWNHICPYTNHKCLWYQPCFFFLERTTLPTILNQKSKSLVGGGVTMEMFKPQILGCLVSGKNSESVRTVIAVSNKALYHISNKALHTPQTAKCIKSCYTKLMKRTQFKRIGSCLLWNLGFAVGCSGMNSSFTLKSNYFNSLVPLPFLTFSFF